MTDRLNPQASLITGTATQQLLLVRNYRRLLVFQLLFLQQLIYESYYSLDMHLKLCYQRRSHIAPIRDSPHHYIASQAYWLWGYYATLKLLDNPI
jgi:hypothetical protein